MWKRKSEPQALTSNNDDGVPLETRVSTHRYDVHDKNADSPVIVNNTEYPIVVFLERGVLYNKKALLPGEAVTMTKKETGILLPYKVHAVLGDESALPSKADSIKNLAKVSVVPAAFIAGCMLTAASAGTLAGPSLALAPLVSGMVVRGVVVDAAALAAGTIAADRAKKVAETVMKNHKEKFMGVSKSFKPGHRYLVVKGGLQNGPVEIEEIRKREFKKLEMATIKRLEQEPKPLLLEAE